MESIWSESCRIREREPLSGHIQAEIAVIGAGIAGLHDRGRHTLLRNRNERMRFLLTDAASFIL